MFLFRCYCCGTTFLLDESVAGKVVRCPMTSQPIRFPQHLPSNFGESQWLAITEPNILASYVNRKASHRKRRLLQCAFCRTRWDLRTRWALKDALEKAEAFADDLTDTTVLEAAQVMLQIPWTDLVLGSARRHLLEAASRALELDVSCRSPAQTPEEKDLHCTLIRDVIGNPFRIGPLIADAWLAWNNAAVVRVAHTIYQQRAFEQLPILADALEDAGCDDADLVGHLRSPGPHTRGCWALDLVLGKD